MWIIKAVHPTKGGIPVGTYLTCGHEEQGREEPPDGVAGLGEQQMGELLAGANEGSLPLQGQRGLPMPALCFYKWALLCVSHPLE